MAYFDPDSKVPIQIQLSFKHSKPWFELVFFTRLLSLQTFTTQYGGSPVCGKHRLDDARLQNVSVLVTYYIYLPFFREPNLFFPQKYVN